MTKRISCIIPLFVSFFVLTANAATTVVVGTCKSGTKFATVQAAVNAVAPGGKVFVCPGIYPEQVTISQPLTLQGVLGSAVLSVPGAGLIQNADGIAAQLLVQDTAGPVTVNNITVDGSNAVCPNPVYWIGVDFGEAVTATLSNSAVKNVSNYDCNGAGISAGRTSTVTIANNSVHGVSGCAVGIVVNDGATSAKITGNVISKCGRSSTSTVSLGGGIAVGSMTGPLTVSSNVIQVSFGSDPSIAPWGIFVGGVHALPPLVSNNVIVGTRVGMSSGIAMTDVVDPTITGNKIAGAYVGISLQGVAGAVIKNDIVSDVDAGISTGRPGDGNTVSGNTVNDALCGIYAPTTPANKFYNVAVGNCYSSGIP